MRYTYRMGLGHIWRRTGAGVVGGEANGAEGVDQGVGVGRPGDLFEDLPFEEDAIGGAVADEEGDESLAIPQIGSGRAALSAGSADVVAGEGVGGCGEMSSGHLNG